MADKKFSQLTVATSLGATDIIPCIQGGVESIITGAEIRKSVGAVPTVNSVGAEFHATGVPTATLPGTHAANDILLLIMQTSNEADYAAPTGYTRLGPQNGIGTGAAAGAVKLHIFWKRDGGSESAPTLTDSGDHNYGVMLAIRGCVTSGDPFRMLGQAWKFTTSTTGTGDAGVSIVPNSLILTVFGHSQDAAGAVASAPTNTSLTNVTEQFDGSTTDGTGGGVCVISGTMATPGDVTATTTTWTNTCLDVSTTIAFIPVDAYIEARNPETMTFIGSPTDLDDTWVKPVGASRVHVQLVDGAGGGSGGNTTTTAAGGGGGGGGGYDEAWYEAEDLGATVTVHAGKGGAAGTALNQAGNAGVLSEFDKGNVGPLTSTRRIAGTAATAAASADGGNGGCGSGRGTASPAVGTRIDLTAATAGAALGGVGGRGGNGSTAAVGGSPADWGGGGGESGSDTDASTTAANNGYSLRGGGGGGGGRTTTNIGGGAMGGGAAAPAATQGTAGNDSTRLPYGGSGGCGGGSSVVTGGTGGFPGGAGGGGAGVAGGFGGRGGHGIVMVTTFF